MLVGAKNYTVAGVGKCILFSATFCPNNLHVRASMWIFTHHHLSCIQSTFLLQRPMYGSSEPSLNSVVIRGVFFKLKQLGFSNQIIDNSKSDSKEFGRRLYDDSDSKVKIAWSITILVAF